MVLLQGPLPQQRPSGSIEGTVTREGSNQPIRRARITLTRHVVRQPNTPAPPPAPAIAPLNTDDKGKYVFPNLEDGSYTLRVEANGYVARDYGQPSPAEVTVNGGQPTKDVNVTLTPGATISGRIRDTSEQALIGVSVQLLQYSYNFDGQRLYRSVGSTITNDRGEYRMYWVTPGRYFLIAGRPTAGENALTQAMAHFRSGGRPNANDVPSLLGYAFYPGVTKIANARLLDLQPGAEVQGVDLAFAPNPPTYAVRGKVIDSRTGQAPPRALIGVATQTPGLSDDGTAPLSAGDSTSPSYNAATGTFELRGLLPGPYTITTTVRDLTPGAPRGAGATGTTSVSIASADVENVVLSVAPNGSISGTLRLEGQLAAGNTIDRLRVHLAPVGGGGARSPMALVSAEGTFQLNDVSPGDYRVEVSSTPARIRYANGFTKSARFDSVDVLATPLRFTGNAGSRLDIVVAGGGGKVSGILTDSRSQPVAGQEVVLVPDRARFQVDIYGGDVTDQNGRFSISVIPPGDYKLFAWESMEPYAYFDPQLLAQYETRGRAVRITETSNETIDLRIIATEGRQ
jgi:hypothetical protein